MSEQKGGGEVLPLFFGGSPPPLPLFVLTNTYNLFLFYFFSQKYLGPGFVGTIIVNSISNILCTMGNEA